jgi:indolepyruvate ferredoxin oxidoreductase beta subunit
MEALRWLNYLKKGGKVVVNDFEINPMPVIMDKREYAHDILDEIKAVADTKVVAATAEAEKLGNGKLMNIVLLGTIIKLMGLEDIGWDPIIRENIKPEFVEQNIKALKKGLELL